ncbi:MAG: calcium-binding protein [Ottowia sp.]|uniref:calcium-binding protein n=1 Tax=Ottowia sp. TaxID=1898956 RepID=UPI0039E5DCB5
MGADGLGSIVVDGVTLTGGEAVGANAWQSEDGNWRYALTETGDLIITGVGKPGRIVVQGFARLQSQQASPLGLNLPQASQPEQPQPAEPGVYALQGDQLAPSGAWQLQADGSIPGATAEPNANNLFEGSDSLLNPGTVRRITGVDGNGNTLTSDTRAVTYWGLGGNDFISGEQYDDHLDGGDGDDAIWGGAGSDEIHGGAGNDIIVSNMSATMPGGYGELPRGADEIKGPDNVVAGTSGSNILRWFVVRGADGSWLRVERAHVKNPDGGEVYVAESESDQDVIDAGAGDDYVWAGRGSDYLIGGAGDDHLAGLGGGDVILGGEGKDVIYGDEWRRMQLQAVTRSRNGDVYGYLPLDEALKSPALHGNDVIDAGAGDDEAWGDGGDDVVHGGSGDDWLFGDALPAQLPWEYHGSDRLDGGDGDDSLFGQGGNDWLYGGAGCIRYPKNSCQRLSNKRWRQFSFKRKCAVDRRHMHESSAS